MAERNIARAAAYSLLRQHKIADVSLDNLAQIAKEMEYSIIDYSKSLEGGYAEKLIKELRLESFARNGKSFAYRKNSVKLIFLCESMNAKEKIYALAHELGHVYCGHLKNGVCCNEADIEEEHEANEFAHYLLHPGWYERIALTICKHKVVTVLIAILLMCGIISIPVIRQIQLNRSYYGEYYVTENGEKYHTADCPIIKDRTNTHRLTIVEYESGAYEPCQICLPEETKKED